MNDEFIKKREVSDTSSSKYKILKTLIQLLKEEYKISRAELLNLYDDAKEIKIPLSIFSGELSPLEAIVKHLKDNLGMKFSQIASCLNRDDRSIWRTYHQAENKKSVILSPNKDELVISVSIFKNRKLSVLENLSIYLKEELSIPVKEISSMLNKKPSTIWTTYNRAKKKKK